MARADGLLLDIDGVLALSWDPIPGAVEALGRLRTDGVPFRLITNTTTHTRRALAQTLREGGFEIAPDEIVTAVTATASYLRAHHPDAAVFVLSDGDAAEDLEGIDLQERPDEAEVVALGGAGEGFTYPTLNAIYRRLMDGAALVGMHRNLFWRTAEGWELDGGAFLTGLEAAAGIEATICGKPTRAYFEAALEPLGVPTDRAAMVGDDVVNDVSGAQEAGCLGVLVCTGKYREGDESKGSPDAVLDSFADVPAWLESQGP